MSALLWALVAVPLGGGALLAAAARRANRVAAPVGVMIATVTLALAVAAAIDRPTAHAPFLARLPVTLRVDGLSEIFVLTTAAVTLLVLVVSAGEMSADPGRGRFFGLMLMFSGAMLVTVTAADLLALLLAWEAMGALSWALIGHWWRDERRVQSAHVAFWTTRLADVGLYLAAGAALAGVATLRFTALGRLSGGWLDLAAAGVVAAALGKSAQLPFSFWLSRAMEGPSPASALLHSAAMVAAGGYLLLRLHPLLAASGWGLDVVAWAGAITALGLGAVAVAQRDLKQLLAASTCSQIGFIVLGAGTGAIVGSTMHFVAHAATKSLLFLGAGAWLTALGTKDLSALRGAARRFPVVGATVAAALLTLGGVPPFSIWLTKDAVLAGALERSPALYAVGLAGVVVSAAYAMKALALLLAPTPANAEDGYDTEQPGTRQVGWLQRGPLIVLAAAAVGLGVQLLPGVAHAYARTLHAAGEPSARTWELALSAALALGAGILAAARPGLGLRLPRPVVAALTRWLDLERLAGAAVARPTLALARSLAAFDDRVLDRRLIDGVIARGTQRVADLARRPQTGQVHQYYAQGVVGLLVLLVIFLLVR